MCKCIIEALGGIIGFDEDMKDGAKFYFSIPCKNMDTSFISNN
jgi:K+-sensing histidine kinase KdpD